MPREWDEGFAVEHMKDYKVYEDKFSSGYIAMLKKSKRYQDYLKLILRPGGIRPHAKKPTEPLRSESIYSDNGGSRTLSIIDTFSAQVPTECQ